MISVNIKEMLECGVHFGHPTRRWNPKMKKYIFGERNGVSIIDLQKTVRAAKKALQFIFDTAANGGKILFVGTKRQAMDVVKEQAERSECYYINHRWLGGLMTNFITIQQSIKRLMNLETMLADESRTKVLKKKELLKLDKQRVRLDRVLHGIKDMKKLPSILFVIDVQKEHIAIAEANKLKIPVVAIVDTNCDPDNIDYIIPGNDDAIRSISLFCERSADAVLEGGKIFKAKKAEEEARKADERAKVEKQRNEERVRRDNERKEREKLAKQKKAEQDQANKKEAEKAKAVEKKEPVADAKKPVAEAKEAPTEKPAKKPSRATKKPAKPDAAPKEDTKKAVAEKPAQEEKKEAKPEKKADTESKTEEKAEVKKKEAAKEEKPKAKPAVKAESEKATEEKAPAKSADKKAGDKVAGKKAPAVQAEKKEEKAEPKEKKAAPKKAATKKKDEDNAEPAEDKKKSEDKK